MKIKVSFEKIFDSKEFYEDASEEDLSFLDENTFKEGLYNLFYDDGMIDELKMEMIDE